MLPAPDGLRAAEHYARPRNDARLVEPARGETQPSASETAGIRSAPLEFDEAPREKHRLRAILSAAFPPAQRALLFAFPPSTWTGGIQTWTTQCEIPAQCEIRGWSGSRFFRLPFGTPFARLSGTRLPCDSLKSCAPRSGSPVL